MKIQTNRTKIRVWGTSILALAFLTGALLSGCTSKPPPAPAISPPESPVESATPQPTPTPSPTPVLDATHAAEWEATLQAGQTQNPAYQTTSSARQTGASAAQATGPAPAPTSSPSRTPSPGPRPVPTSRPAQISLDKCSSREGWNRFTDGYYGYSICIPPSAEVSKESRIEVGFFSDDVPVYWQHRIDQFHFLNMTYPPGLRVEISDRSWFIWIVVPESLGGKYVDNFIGGLGEEDGFVWSWTEEEVVIEDQAHTATVLRQCESHDPGAQCEDWEIYSVRLGDGSTLRFGSIPNSTDGRYPEEKAKMLAALRTYRIEPKVELYCPHPPPYRLAAGMIASLDRAAPLDFPVWSAPGINQGSVDRLERGEGVEVLKGPVCNNNMQWWKVRSLSGGMEGWAPEGNHWAEFLLPVTGIYECPSGWSRLRVGGRAKVSEDSALPNRVRPEPSASAESIALLEPGTEVRVVEGPVCADGLFFWRVESEAIPGGVGWTAEGDGEENYLEPVISGD